VNLNQSVIRNTKRITIVFLVRNPHLSKEYWSGLKVSDG
jgi:hypothetical protein